MAPPPRGVIAQLVERVVRNDEVWSSILHGSTIFLFLPISFYWHDWFVGDGVGVEDEGFETPLFAGLDGLRVRGGGGFGNDTAGTVL